MENIWQRVRELLEDRRFIRYAAGFDRRPLINLVNQLQGPRMLLIHWSTLAQIQRIPHSDENLAVDALEAISKYGAGMCEIFMVSHRWLRL